MFAFTANTPGKSCRERGPGSIVAVSVTSDPSPDDQREARTWLDHGRFGVLGVLLAAPFVAFPPDFVSKALLDGGDDLLANIPELVYSGKKLLEGELLWMPELWMGHPLLAEPEFATFYLPKLLLLLGQPFVLYAAYLVLHYLAAEGGAYLYLKSLGIGRAGAVFGALAYAYAGFMLGHRAHTMYIVAAAWTPFVLLAFDRAARGGRLSYLVAALAFAMVPFSGAVQLTVYLAGLLVLLAASRAFFERALAPLRATAMGLLPSLLVSAAQLWPSREYSRQLATYLRDDYALDVMHSFHPLLLPTLAWPAPPIEGELYSRAGLVVVCAAVVALVNLRTASSTLRAWAVVAAVALVLMLGRYVPVLPHLLHGLPVVGVLRGPARHNYELGLALAVLGAYGVDVAMRRGAGALHRWLLGGAVFGAASYGVLAYARAGHVTDAAAANQLSVGSSFGVVVAVALFALWLGALAVRRGRVGAALWTAVVLAPLLETVWVMRVEFWPNRSALGLLEVARDALPAPGAHVRILGMSPLRGSVDDLAGNSVLFHPGVESLQGYSSIAYTEAREVLDLDMHGQPRFHDELALSVLPSIYGVTHVVLPSLACAAERASLERPYELCEVKQEPSGPALSVAHGQLDCTVAPAESTLRYGMELIARTANRESADPSFSFVGSATWERRFGVTLPGPALDVVPLTRKEFVHLADGESWGALLLDNPRATPVEFAGARLFVDSDVTVAALSPSRRSELDVKGALISGNAIRLDAHDGEASVELHFRLPRIRYPASAVAVLEVEARAPGAANDGATASELHVDLHGKDYDPDDAELVVRTPQLGRDFGVARAPVRLDGAPEELSLRARLASGGPVELRSARLVRTFEETAYTFPVAVNRFRPGVDIDRARVTLAPHVTFAQGMHLPIRAFDVVLDAESSGPLDGSAYFGVEPVTPTHFDEPRGWALAKDTFVRRARVHHVAVLPPDDRDPKLFVRVDGNASLRVNALTARDACTERGYRNPKRLANGLFLYENPAALPRAYTVSVTTRAPDAAAVRTALLDFSPSDLGRRAVVFDDVPPELRQGVVESAVFGQRTDDVVVRSDGGPTLLVVNERFDPDIGGTLDGAPAHVLRVNGFVRGVLVPAGRHRVHLEYRAPRAVWIGAALAVAGVLVALGFGRLRPQNSV
ncbi:MAG TPA: hypothetical protein VH062_00685 [Polyangiaceae bacterium]|jgi:hypothetical protein|nr:hypothetical protein [Polyangiaceae bacterium]